MATPVFLSTSDKTTALPSLYDDGQVLLNSCHNIPYRLLPIGTRVTRKRLHPPFKATWTGARRTRLGNYDFCPTLAETKRKNIILDHMNSRICLGSSQFWLHKFGQITIKFSGSPCGQERLNSNSCVASDHQIVIIIIKRVFGCVENSPKSTLSQYTLHLKKLRHPASWGEWRTRFECAAG